MFLSCPQKDSFQMYECYCQNKPRSEALWRQFSDCAYFQVSLAVISFSVECDYFTVFCVFTISVNVLIFVSKEIIHQDVILILFVFFVKECQKKLEHKLGLDSYLLKPVQRLTKYQLLLKVKQSDFLCQPDINTQSFICNDV